MSHLDLTSLKNALQQLEKGIVQSDANPENDLQRDGAIQRFEYCFELSIKMMKRSLEVQFDENVDAMNFRDILRTAFEHQLISDATHWFQFRDERNKTAHTYDQNIAIAVFAFARKFLPEAQFLFKKLEQANH